MSDRWPSLNYGEWSETCDTLHAHTQVLGKLAAALAPPEPQLQHAALLLTARGFETQPLPAPDGSGAVVVALGLGAACGRGGVPDVPPVVAQPVTAMTAPRIPASRKRIRIAHLTEFQRRRSAAPATGAFGPISPPPGPCQAGEARYGMPDWRLPLARNLPGPTRARSRRPLRLPMWAPCGAKDVRQP